MKKTNNFTQRSKTMTTKATIKIEMNGRLVDATYSRHLRTMTYGSGCDQGKSMDHDAYRLEDGTIVIATSPESDGRATPVVIEGATLADYGR